MCEKSYNSVISSVQKHMKECGIDRSNLHTFVRGSQKGISFKEYSDDACAVFCVNDQWYAYSFGLMRDIPITAQKASELAHCFFTSAIIEINRLVKKSY